MVVYSRNQGRSDGAAPTTAPVRFADAPLSICYNRVVPAPSLRLCVTHSVGPSDQLLVRASRAAQILDISLRSFRRLEARGDIEGVHLTGHIVRYSVDDLRAMLGPHHTMDPEPHRRPAAAWLPRRGGDGETTISVELTPRQLALLLAAEGDDERVG